MNQGIKRRVNRRPPCRCGHTFLLNIPEWITSPCSQCECRDYGAASAREAAR